MRALTIFCLATFVFASCKEGWTDEHKTNYKNQCMQEAGGMYATREQAEEYCDCNLASVMKAYEHPSDILENYDSTAVRKALEECSLNAQQ